MTAQIVLLMVFAAIVIVYAAAGVRVVRPYQKGLVEQLGKYKKTVDPGFHFIAPIYQTLRPVDMREQVVEVPPEEVITEDNVVVSVDAVIYYAPTEPQRLVYNVANFMVAVTKLAQTTLRDLIGEMRLDEALTSREKINNGLREILDDATDKWGVRVARVKIKVSIFEPTPAQAVRKSYETSPGAQNLLEQVRSPVPTLDRTEHHVEPHAFVSYPHRDKPYVKRLVEQLRSSGVSVWYDGDIPYGASWSKEIRDRIETASAFVVVMSGEEPTDEVQAEIDWAIRHRRVFLPISRDESIWFRVDRVHACKVYGDDLPSNDFTSAVRKAIEGPRQT